MGHPVDPGCGYYDVTNPKECFATEADAVAQEKNPAAVALGKLGGSKGGKARAKNMTPEQRSESARKAAKARWEKKRQQESS